MANPGAFRAVFVRLGACAAALAAIAWPASADSRVTLHTADGVTIVGTYFEPSRRPAPMVVLLHMPTRSRADWRALGERLAARGIGALAIDLRGHGESGLPAMPESTTSAPVQRSASVRDVHAALAWLKGRPESAAGRPGIVGASLGASLGALAAAEDPAVRAVVLLSGTLDFRGVRLEPAMRKLTDRAVLLVASREDGYASRTARQLSGGAPGNWEVRELDGAGHGTTMLARQPELLDALVDWLSYRLL